jgi:hypothetical protein
MRRRRDAWVAAALGAAVLAIVALGIFTGAFGGGPSTGAPSAAADPRLLEVVPPAFRSTCVRSSSPPPSAAAAVECTDGDDYAVSYSRFGSLDEVQAAFESFAAPADATSTDCGHAASARGEYSVNGVRAGEVACYVEEGTSPGTTESVIVWTDEALSVLGRAIRRDPADLTLYGWWRTDAGPWGSAAAPAKDGTSPAPIEGRFEATHRSHTLEFRGGRYWESDYSELYGDAAVLYGKPSLLVLLHESPPTTFGGVVCPRYEVYRYRLSGDRLVLHLVTGSCREYASHDIDGAGYRRVT